MNSRVAVPRSLSGNSSNGQDYNGREPKTLGRVIVAREEPLRERNWSPSSFDLVKAAWEEIPATTGRERPEKEQNHLYGHAEISRLQEIREAIESILIPITEEGDISAVRRQLPEESTATTASSQFKSSNNKTEVDAFEGSLAFLSSDTTDKGDTTNTRTSLNTVTATAATTAATSQRPTSTTSSASASSRLRLTERFLNSQSSFFFSPTPPKSTSPTPSYLPAPATAPSPDPTQQQSQARPQNLASFFNPSLRSFSRPPAHRLWNPVNSSPRINIIDIARSSSSNSNINHDNSNLHRITTAHLTDPPRSNPQTREECYKSSKIGSHESDTNNSKDEVKLRQKETTTVDNNDRSFLNFEDEDCEQDCNSGIDKKQYGDDGHINTNHRRDHFQPLTASVTDRREQSDRNDRRDIVLDTTATPNSASEGAAVPINTTTIDKNKGESSRHKLRMDPIANARPVADNGMGAERRNGQQETERTYSLSSNNALKPDDLEAGRKVRRSASRASMPLSHNDNLNQSNNDNNAINDPSNNNDTINNDSASTPEDFLWGPDHPCFPHLNPHVPLSSPLHSSTRIVRVRRNWMAHGDLAPQFTNLYPEVLDPFMAEEQFRRVVEHVNMELAEAFSPRRPRAWVDAVLGALTGWIWDDLGMTGAKKQLEALEAWIETWNKEYGAKGNGDVEDGNVWIVPLRRTGYMTLDIQIPDPQISLVTGETMAFNTSAPPTRAGSRTGSRLMSRSGSRSRSRPLSPSGERSRSRSRSRSKPGTQPQLQSQPQSQSHLQQSEPARTNAMDDNNNINNKNNDDKDDQDTRRKARL